MKRFLGKITNLSYLHIGSGENLNHFDYLLDNEKNLYKIYWFRLLKSELSSEFKKIIDLEYEKILSNKDIINQSIYILKNFLKENIDILRHLYLIEKISHLEQESINIENLENIKILIRAINPFSEQLTPYLPGSSIKGALKSFINLEKASFEELIIRDFYSQSEVRTVIKRVNRVKILDQLSNAKEIGPKVYLELIEKNQVFEGEILISNYILERLKNSFQFHTNKKTSFYRNIINSNLKNILYDKNIYFSLGFGFGRSGKTRFRDEENYPLGVVKLELKEI